MTDVPIYVLERVFNAPREQVWRAWTEKDLLSHWYGPGVETVIHALDVRVGGIWLNEMRMKDQSGYQKAEYLEVVPVERLVMIQSNTDADWNVMANPGMPDWPKTMLLTVVFNAEGDKTRMHMSWAPHDASSQEIACFANMMDRMGGGWGAGMDVLETLLADL
ncbi:MAG: SRPBCC domain-containing protein [Pseudomonadota bacterium]